MKPIDFYVSGFGGYSFPFKTDLSFQGTTVISDLGLDKSASFGGKVGMWFTTSRKTLGIDIGTEVDVTNFNPDTPGTLQLNATYFGVHVLARVPMGVTPELPLEQSQPRKELEMELNLYAQLSEEALIGVVFFSTETFLEISSELDINDFQSARCKTIFQASHRLRDEGAFGDTPLTK